MIGRKENKKRLPPRPRVTALAKAAHSVGTDSGGTPPPKNHIQSELLFGVDLLGCVVQ